jgi:uncharacterized protein DUF4105
MRPLKALLTLSNRTTRWGLILLAALAIALMLVWSTLAIYFSNLPGQGLRTAAAAAFGLGWLAAFAFLRRRGRTALWFLLAFAAVVGWFVWIPASNQRDWAPEYGRAPSADIAGDRVTVHDIRDFDYRSETDFTVRYHDQTYDLKDLQTVDLIKSQWAGPDIVHTMLSFGFRGGAHLAVSAETRRELGEPQGAIRGLFKQYELAYILGEERDLFRLRTTFRKEDVFLYPLKFTPAEVRVVFLDLLARVNQVAAHPEFYNTLTENCTMTLIPLFDKVRRTPKKWFDIRALINGRTDEAVIENGTVALDLPLDLEQAREVCHVNQYVKDHPEADGFSRRIRTHIPSH